MGEGRHGGEVMGVVRECVGLHLVGDQARDEGNSRDLLGPRSVDFIPKLSFSTIQVFQNVFTLWLEAYLSPS